MLDVINDVLEAEARAETTLNEARTEATGIRNEFAELESRTLREAQSEADLKLRTEIASIREEQDRRVALADERLRAEATAFTPESIPGFSDAVDQAVALITGGE